MIARLPVRVRVTAAATLALALALAVTGMAFSRALRDQERDALVRAAEQRIADTVALVESGRAATPLPAARDSTLLVQAVRADGTVLGSSANVMDMDRPFVDKARHPVGGDIGRWSVVVDGADCVLLGQAADGPDGPAAVYVAAPLSGLDASSAALRSQLLRWTPVLLALCAALMWIVTGRALRPVDVLRAEVDAIGPGELSRRVTEPAVGDEVGRLAVTMNAMLGRVEEAAVRQERFVSDASHELRSPLAALRTRLEVALRNPERADWPAVGRAALEQGARMERLVADLLALARTGEGAGRDDAGWTGVDLGDVVMDAVADARAAGTGGVRIDVSAVAGGLVRGDAEQLRRLVENLLSNAVRHAATTVAVTVQSAGGGVVVAVDDDGAGIPEADRARVFERFVRLDESRARTDGGAGLGLSIVAEIARRHGGAVSARQAEHLGGASLVVVLPEG